MAWDVNSAREAVRCGAGYVRVAARVASQAWQLTESSQSSQDGTATQKTFVHAPSSIEAEEAEEIGVEHLLRDVKNLSVGTLSSRVSDQLSSLRGLQSRLSEIKAYLENVVAGKLPVNHQIIYNLQDVFNLLPNLDAAVQAGEGPHGLKRPFTVATNDQLLVMYLSSLVRAVIALHDLVLNKQAANEQGREEPEEEEDAAEKKEEDGKTGAQKAADWFAAGDKEKKKDEDKGKKDDQDKRGH